MAAKGRKSGKPKMIFNGKVRKSIGDGCLLQ